TVPHALMMLGVEPFLRRFQGQASLQAALSRQPAARDAALALVSRGYHAALYARDFGSLRHDIDVDEVVTAALLVDLARPLVWGCGPDRALEIARLIEAAPAGGADAAHHAVLGFGMHELQVALAEVWRLPQTLYRLMDGAHSGTTRAQTVVMSASIARHSA